MFENKYLAAALISAIITLVLTFLPNRSHMSKELVVPMVSAILTMYFVGELIGNSYNFDIIDISNMVGLFFFSYGFMYLFEKINIRS